MCQGRTLRLRFRTGFISLIRNSEICDQHLARWLASPILFILCWMWFFGIFLLFWCSMDNYIFQINISVRIKVVTRLMVPSDSAQKWGRAGNLAGALQFFNFIPRPLPIIIFILVFLCSCVFICHPRPHHRNPSLGLQAYSTPTICHGVPVGCISFLWLPIYLFRVLCKHAKSNNFCIMCEIFCCLFYMLIEFCPVFGVWGENFAYYSANRP